MCHASTPSRHRIRETTAPATRTPLEGAFYIRDCRLGRRSGVDFRCLRFRRCCEPLSKRAEILELGFRQLMVPLAEVPQCILEPLNLVFRVSADHTTPH